MFETIYSSPTNYTLKKLPSVREQVELCRHIASQLVANDNINSKGANMFFKRVKKAHTWEVPPLDSKEQEMIENIDEDKMRQQLAETLLRNKEHRLSLVLDPRGKIHSLSSLKADGQKVNEHNAVTPDMMSRLMKDLESPEANPKAAELFAKRKAMSHEWELVKEPVLKPPEQRIERVDPDYRASEQQMQRMMPAPQQQQMNNSHKVNGWQSESTIHRQQRATQVRGEECYGKRFSLLDPEIFVPTAGSRLHASPSSQIKAPSPWKPVAGSFSNNSSVTVAASRVLFDESSSSGAECVRGGSNKTLTPSWNPAPHPPLPPASSSFSPSPVSFVRNDKYDDLPSLPSLLPPMSSLCVSPASMDGSTQSNPGSSDSNNFSNYTNYFYQTLKHSNPYQNLPESILL